MFKMERELCPGTMEGLVETEVFELLPCMIYLY